MHDNLHDNFAHYTVVVTFSIYEEARSGISLCLEYVNVASEHAQTMAGL